jgi:hypothetical protein
MASAKRPVAKRTTSKRPVTKRPATKRPTPKRPARKRASAKRPVARARGRRPAASDYTPAEEQPFLWDPTTWEGAEAALGRKRIRPVLTAPAEPLEPGLADAPPPTPIIRRADVTSPARPKGATKKRPPTRSGKRVAKRQTRRPATRKAGRAR